MTRTKERGTHPLVVICGGGELGKCIVSAFVCAFLSSDAGTVTERNSLVRAFALSLSWSGLVAISGARNP